MAIALHANAASSITSGASDPHTFAYDAGASGTDTILIVSAYTETTTPASVTYNGVSMTYIGGQDGGGNRVDAWYLANPSTGSNTLSLTQGGATADQIITAVCYSGVDQTTPVGTPVYQSQTVSSPGEVTTTLDTTAANSYIFTAAGMDGGPDTSVIGPISTFSDIAGTNEGATTTSGASGVTMGCYDRSAATATTYTVGFDFQESSEPCNAIHFELFESSGGGAGAALASDLTASGTVTADLSLPAAQLAADLSGSAIVAADLTLPADQLAASLTASCTVTADLTMSAAQLAADLTASATINALFGFESFIYDGSNPDPGTTESVYEASQTDGDLGGGGFTAANPDALYIEPHPDVTWFADTTFIVSPPQTITLAYKWFDDSAGTFTSESRLTILDNGSITSLASDLNASATVTADLTVPAIGAALASDLSASGTVTADLTLPADQLAAALTATGIVTADLTVGGDSLACDMTASAVLTADLTAQSDALNAALVATATITADLTVPADALACDMSATGLITADLTIPTDGLAADLSGSATITADLTLPADQLSAALTGTATVTGDLTIPGASLAATLNANGTVTADLTFSTALLAADLTASGTITADLTIPADQLAAALTGSATITANLRLGGEPMFSGTPSDVTLGFADDLITVNFNE